MKVSMKALKKELVRLVKESPDNVYANPKDCDRIGCQYSEGICKDGSVGCIFGQAFRNLGVSEDKVKRLDMMQYQTSIRFILPEKFHITHEKFISWCGVLQNAQDKRRPWKQALEIANRRVELPKSLREVE